MGANWEFSEEAFRNSVTRLIERVRNATEDAVKIGGEHIANMAKDEFGPAHPRGTRKTVFDRPQSVSGELRRSIQFIDSRQTGANQWTGRTAPQTAYGRRIELGFNPSTRGGGLDILGRQFHQRPYPYLEPGVRKSEVGLEQIFTRAWRRAM